MTQRRRKFRLVSRQGSTFKDQRDTDPSLVNGLPSDRPLKRRRGIYLLPNAFTTAALFSAFYAIIQGMNDNFVGAAIGIFAAMVLDGMDGRVARLTGTQSAFGEQLDSLADMVSFGVAPALVMYEFILKDIGRWGWLAAFVYCACAALRGCSVATARSMSTTVTRTNPKICVGSPALSRLSARRTIPARWRLW